MTPERWQAIKQQVNSTFSDIDAYEEDLDPGTAEVLEFESPQGKMQLKFISRPRVLDKKTTYSNRAGSDVKVDYVFSEDEVVHHLELKIWDETSQDWKEIDAEKLF